MKIFRRVLYALLMLTLLGGVGEIISSRPEDSEGPPLLLIIAFGGVLGTLLWSTVFLKEEPILTRVALVVLLVALVAFMLWAGQSQIRD